MLISHRYKFIYIKNRKVAGTSIEAFFERYCLSPEQEITHASKHERTAYISSHGIIGSRQTKSRGKWFGHLPASAIQTYIGKKAFNRYYKFCVVRNPWDKVVSHYRSRGTKYKERISFEQHVHITKNLDWWIYTINNTPVCNFYIRFENLEEGIRKVTKKLGISNYIKYSLPTYKQRLEKVDYKIFYTQKTQNIVARQYKDEIKLFSYTFA